VSSYILSVDADLDLDDIWEYIAADDIDAADRWLDTCAKTWPLTRFCSGRSARTSSFVGLSDSNEPYPQMIPTLTKRSHECERGTQECVRHKL